MILLGFLDNTIMSTKSHFAPPLLQLFLFLISFYWLELLEQRGENNGDKRHPGLVLLSSTLMNILRVQA